MKFETTSFENIHESSEIKHSFNQEYVYHNITVWNELIFNNHKFQLTYQAGHEYLHGDYSAPSNKLSLADAGNESLIELANMFESDFDNEEYDEYLNDLLSDLKKYGVSTKDEMLELYVALNENTSNAESYRMHEMELSSDIDDHDRSEFDEHGFKYVGA